MLDARKKSIVFFGSGPVASKSLELLAKNFVVEAVVTKPKPAHHHGSFPVLETSQKLGLKTHTVASKAELSKLIAARPFKSQAGVLIDFGIIVAQNTIDYFPKGIVNSHFSLLPEWRGADPITFSILNGQKQTGVSLMLLVEKMDEGPLLGFGIQEIEPSETTVSLTEKLIYLSDGLLKIELPRYLATDAKLINQLDISSQMTVEYPSKPTYSRKLTKEDGRIDWTKPAVQLEREIRAYSEWPKSYTTIAGKDVIVTKAHISQGKGQRAKGAVYQTDDKELVVQTDNGLLIIDRLKPSGKNEMTAKEFLSGYGNSIPN